MFIAVVGTQFAGKSSIEQFLIDKYGFLPVGIKSQEDEITMNKNPNPKRTLFETPESLLDHVTRHWLEPFVTCDLNSPDLIEPFHKRPFFLLVTVDAPLLIRFKRICQVYPNHTLEEFITQHDNTFYYEPTTTTTIPTTTTLGKTSRGLRQIFQMSHINVINTFQSLKDLHSHLESLDLTCQDRLRPRWDTYFMTLASLASLRSNCMKRRVGAILVRDRRILATGYNGTPRTVRNCNEGGCKRCNSGVPSGQSLDDCLCLHAEENALLEAGRERVGIGSVLYCNTCPCLGCAIKIVQTGVKEVVYNLSYKVDDRTEALFKEAGIILRQHSPPQLE